MATRWRVITTGARIVDDADEQGVTILPNSIKSFWENVKQDAPNELPRAQKPWCHVASLYKGMRDWLDVKRKCIDFATIGIWNANPERVALLYTKDRPRELVKEIRRYHMPDIITTWLDNSLSHIYRSSTSTLRLPAEIMCAIVPHLDGHESRLAILKAFPADFGDILEQHGKWRFTAGKEEGPAAKVGFSYLSADVSGAITWKVNPDRSFTSLIVAGKQDNKSMKMVDVLYCFARLCQGPEIEQSGFGVLHLRTSP